MSVLRIDSAKAGKDDAKYECVAENGVGDAVVASATLSIYPGTVLRNKRFHGRTVLAFHWPEGPDRALFKKKIKK